MIAETKFTRRERRAGPGYCQKARDHSSVTQRHRNVRPSPLDRRKRQHIQIMTGRRPTLPARSDRLLKRDLGEAAQLARMQAFRFLVLEPLQRRQADLKMLADALAVEFAGHARELDFAVQWL